MDNVRVRRMCDELLTLENPKFQSYNNEEIKKSYWMRTLNTRRGTYINRYVRCSVFAVCLQCVCSVKDCNALPCVAVCCSVL